MSQQHREHVDELIDAYVLGALQPEDMARVEDHIQTCASCRERLAAARATAETLLYAAPLVEPPVGLRDRVLRGVHTFAEQERRGEVPVVRAQPGTARRQATTGRGPLARLLGNRRREPTAGDETLDELAALLANPESLVWDVNGTTEASGARGQLVGAPGGRQAVLVVSGMARLSRGEAYQVWLLRAGQPIPNALFRVGARGEGHLIVRSSFQLRDVDAIAVTPEPAAGSATPTGPIVLTGPLSH